MRDKVTLKKFLFTLVFLLAAGWMLAKNFSGNNNSLHLTTHSDDFLKKSTPQRKIASTHSTDQLNIKKLTPQKTDLLPPQIGTERPNRQNDWRPVANEAIDVNGVENVSLAAAAPPSAPPHALNYYPETVDGSLPKSSDLVEKKNNSNDFTTYTNVTAPSMVAATSPSSARESTNFTNKISCSTSVAEGTYSYPFTLYISCSSSATIRYCLSADGCCEPDSSQGQSYEASSPIIIGQTDANYCLSYQAVDSSNESTEVTTKRYIINKTSPDLYSELPIKWLQTTEAPLIFKIHSDHFGSNNYFTGVINYRTHNIGLSGDNLSCEELITEKDQYNFPSPIDLLNPFSVAALTPSSSIEIPLAPQNLSYGINYLATYFTDENHPLPLYSCNITEVNLTDFELIENSAMSRSGDLVGGFTPLGFYEHDLSLPRMPAGQSTHSESNYKIETGMLSIFY